MGAAVAVMANEPDPRPVYRYRWRMRTLLPERRGQLCRKVGDPRQFVLDGEELLTVGTGAKALIEFSDGTRVVAPLAAIYGAKPRIPPRPVQRRAFSFTMLVSVGGKRMTVKQAATEAGISVRAVWKRVVKLGWPLRRALEAPVDARFSSRRRFDNDW